jgi:hypothetical protein
MRHPSSGANEESIGTEAIRSSVAHLVVATFLILTYYGIGDLCALAAGAILVVAVSYQAVPLHLHSPNLGILLIPLHGIPS